MRILFAGTPDAAVPSLDRLSARHDIAWVVTRPDAPRGRKRVITPSPVAERADELGLRTLKTSRFDESMTRTVTESRVDLGVIVAYGALVREPLLSSPRLGWINLHFSLLPRWRGAAPVQHAVIAGDTETGAAVMRLDPELDAGDVYAMIARPIGDSTAGELLEELATSGAGLLERVVDELGAGTAVARPQEGEVTFAPKLRREDGRIDWTQATETVMRRIRGTTPEPGAFGVFAGEPLKIVTVSQTDRPGLRLAPGVLALADGVVVGTGDGVLLLTVVQPAGRRAMSAKDWWHGLPTDAALDAR